MSCAELSPRKSGSIHAKALGAFLGAAVGDALGWPQEDRANRVGYERGRDAAQSSAFAAWVRRAGGRFHLHEEAVRAGEYSDDTQLILCTSRSISHGPDWPWFYVRRELPAWTFYERGGGGATKRAALTWLSGREPWQVAKKSDVRRYFEAGGNGVAMRIMPHSLAGARDEDFARAARDIMANGVSTHGHPRALVGALAYGYAVWQAFREAGTLPYGALIERTLAGAPAWTAIPELQSIWPSWRAAADDATGGKYAELWECAVGEMRILLEQASAAMQLGALAVDEVVLNEFGCSDKHMAGAGTVAAAAAIFLASRHAADPINGVIEAAFARGTDTDTIASMTGALLGAISGPDWLGHFAMEVQDAGYIMQQATRSDGIPQAAPNGSADEIVAPSRRELDAFSGELRSATAQSQVLLPDGRTALVTGLDQHESKTKTGRAVSWRLLVNDGQSVYVKRLFRIKAEAPAQPVLPIGRGDTVPSSLADQNGVVRVSLVLSVRDLERSLQFYAGLLGMGVLKRSENHAVLAGAIVLRKRDMPNATGDSVGGAGQSPVINIEVRSLGAVHRRIVEQHYPLEKDLTQTPNRLLLRCADPDGNAVELFEIARTESGTNK